MGPDNSAQARYKTDWFSITVAPSLSIANAAAYGHDSGEIARQSG
jgi:hypothetical protein